MRGWAAERARSWGSYVSGALPDLKKQSVSGDAWDGEGEDGVLIDLNPGSKRLKRACRRPANLKAASRQIPDIQGQLSSFRIVAIDDKFDFRAAPDEPREVVTGYELPDHLL